MYIHTFLLPNDFLSPFLDVIDVTRMSVSALFFILQGDSRNLSPAEFFL